MMAPNQPTHEVTQRKFLRPNLAGQIRRIPELLEFSWLYVIPFVSILGVFVILIYSAQLPSGVRWGAFGTGLVIGSSAFLTGGIVGFLFGIPRTVQGSSPNTGATQYQGNTNLEQVSDWLTKIIVGVSLVQIGRIEPALSRLAGSMKEPLGGQPSSAAFGLGLAIANALMGFLFFYLWSRELFARELRSDSDRRQGDPAARAKPSAAADQAAAASQAAAAGQQADQPNH